MHPKTVEIEVKLTRDSRGAGKFSNRKVIISKVIIRKLRRIKVSLIILTSNVSTAINMGILQVTVNNRLINGFKED